MSFPATVPASVQREAAPPHGDEDVFKQPQDAMGYAKRLISRQADVLRLCAKALGSGCPPALPLRSVPGARRGVPCRTVA